MDEMNETVFVNTEIKQDDIVSNDAANDAGLDQLYRELGQAYYEGGFEDPLPQLLPLFERITSLVKQQEKTSTEENSITEDRQAMPVCAKCGAQLPANAVFCGACGSPVAEQKKPRTCGSCGSPLSDGAIFCGICGASVETGR